MSLNVKTGLLVPRFNCGPLTWQPDQSRQQGNASRPRVVPRWPQDISLPVPFRLAACRSWPRDCTFFAAPPGLALPMSQGCLQEQEEGRARAAVSLASLSPGEGRGKWRALNTSTLGQCRQDTPWTQTWKDGCCGAVCAVENSRRTFDLSSGEWMRNGR